MSLIKHKLAAATAVAAAFSLAATPAAAAELPRVAGQGQTVGRRRARRRGPRPPWPSRAAGTTTIGTSTAATCSPEC